MAQPVDEQLSVWIEHDLNDTRVIQGDAELIAECLLKLEDESGVRTKLGHGSLLKTGREGQVQSDSWKGEA